MRGGVERVVIVVGRSGNKIRDAVARSGVAGKVQVEFLEDRSEQTKQFHAKSILRARYVHFALLVSTTPTLWRLSSS